MNSLHSQTTSNSWVPKNQSLIYLLGIMKSLLVNVRLVSFSFCNLVTCHFWLGHFLFDKNRFLLHSIGLKSVYLQTIMSNSSVCMLHELSCTNFGDGKCNCRFITFITTFWGCPAIMLIRSAKSDIFVVKNYHIIISIWTIYSPPAQCLTNKVHSKFLKESFTMQEEVWNM